MNKNRRIFALLCLACWVFIAYKASWSFKGEKVLAATKPVIGFSLADLKEERWKRDRDYFVAKVAELGGEVLIQDAGGDAQIQIEQCKNLILQGAQVLVVIPKNADAAAPIVIHAREKGIPVISYDRLIGNAPVDLYISFDNFLVGKIQAREVLKRVPRGEYLLLGGDPADQNSSMIRSGQLEVLSPALRKGDIEIIAQPFCDKWLRAEATRYTQDALVQHPDLAAVVASNDGTAGGALAALRAKGLAGKVALSGQDADLEACRNIAKGFQTVTVYKPIRKIAECAAHLAVRFAIANEILVEIAEPACPDAKFIKLQNGKFHVPTYFLEPIVVTQGNLEATVIADGFHPKEKVYAVGN